MTYSSSKTNISSCSYSKQVTISLLYCCTLHCVVELITPEENKYTEYKLIKVILINQLSIKILYNFFGGIQNKTITTKTKNILIWQYTNYYKLLPLLKLKRNCFVNSRHYFVLRQTRGRSGP